MLMAAPGINAGAGMRWRWRSLTPRRSLPAEEPPRVALEADQLTILFVWHCDSAIRLQRVMLLSPER